MTDHYTVLQDRITELERSKKLLREQNAALERRAEQAEARYAEAWDRKVMFEQQVDALTARAEQAEAERDAALAWKDEVAHEDVLNGEAIMLVRQHLSAVGIEAPFVDDVAAQAAEEIRTTRARAEQAEAERDAKQGRIDELERRQKMRVEAMLATTPGEPE